MVVRPELGRLGTSVVGGSAFRYPAAVDADDLLAPLALRGLLRVSRVRDHCFASPAERCLPAGSEAAVVADGGSPGEGKPY